MLKHLFIPDITNFAGSVITSFIFFQLNKSVLTKMCFYFRSSPEQRQAPAAQRRCTQMGGQRQRRRRHAASPSSTPVPHCHHQRQTRLQTWLLSGHLSREPEPLDRDRLQPDHHRTDLNALQQQPGHHQTDPLHQQICTDKYHQKLQ